MKCWSAAVIALGMASPAAAASYHIVLDQPAGGRLIRGHMGLQAADERTGAALVRVIAPGNAVEQRGTVRVLVKNMGDRPFEVGPEEVTLKLGDGTVLKPVPVDAFERRKEVMEQGSRQAQAADLSNRNTLSTLAGQASGSAPITPGVSAPGANELTHVDNQDSRADTMLLPHGESLDAIYQILIPLMVAPGQSWGGYYVFDVPKDVQKRRSDQPLSIAVRTGNETHRFSGTMRWK